MSYQKKSKSPLIYVLLLVSTPFLIFSFTSPKKPKSQKKSNQEVLVNPLNETPGLNYLQCFKMEKKTVDDYLAGGTGKKRLILELGTSNITSADPEFSLFSYLAKNHRTHGAGENPIEIKALVPTGRCYEFLPDTKYIIGNNYVTLKKLKAFIDRLTGDYAYLKFTPYLTTTNHIAFRFSAHITKGDREETVETKEPQKPKKPFSEPDETNPCPPNKPTD